MQNKFDLIIVGAGLVGCSLAIALRQQGLKIAVLERHLPDFTQPLAAHFRPISLAHASVNILRTLELWSLLSADAAAITDVHVSEQGHLGALHFSAQEMGVAALGQVVPFTRLHQCLYETLAELSEVSILPIAEIEGISINDKTTLTVKNAHGTTELMAPLLVGCDGAQSTVRDVLNLKTSTKPQQEFAQTAQLGLARDYLGVAQERITPYGTLAILPLKNPRTCGLVWTMNEEMASQSKTWDEQRWQTFIAECFSTRIPAITAVQRGHQFPLQTIIAEQQYVKGAVLLGNAAHTIYPLAAQGFNLSLRDAAALAEVLVEAQKAGEFLGGETVLQKYLTWREQDQKRIRHLTDSIAHLSALRLPLSRRVRGLGLLLTDLVPPLKKRLAKSAMGLAGKLPKLVRGVAL